MKRVIAAISLTVLILLLCLYGKHVTQEGLYLVQDTMEQIEIDLANGETESALQRSETFLSEWDAHHGRMCLFLQHEHLDPLESVFAVLPYYIEQNEITLARAECRMVRTMTEHILKTEQITLENIL